MTKKTEHWVGWVLILFGFALDLVVVALAVDRWL